MKHEDALLRSRIFASAPWIAGMAVVFALCAMWQYPGGTSLDAHTAGYSLSRNFLSDLGMTVAYNGEPNAVGVACFVASMLVMVAGAIAVLGQWVRVYVAVPESRGVARAAGALGVLVCGAFVGVAFTPENTVMPLHVGTTLLAFRTAPAAMTLFAWASYRTSRLPRRIAHTWTALAVVMTMYVAFITFGPSTATDAGLRTMVLAQKLVTVVGAGLLLLQCAHVRRPVWRRMR